MRSLSFFLITVGAFLLAGCVADNRVPAVERERKIASLLELTGTYKNVGWCPALQCNAAPLTELLFSSIRFPRVPDAIRVTVVGQRTVRCEALLEGAAVADRKFVEGVDFHLEDGRIPLSSAPAVGAESEAASIGVGFRAKTLFLSPAGDIILSTHSGGVGVFLLIIPFASVGYDDCVYERLDKKG